MPLLETLGTFLASQGCGTVGTDLFLGKLPEVRGTVLWIFEYGGEPSVQTMRRPVLQTPRFQVCGRSDAYAVARARVERVWTLLDGYRGGAMPGVYWVEALGPPFRIGADDNARELIGVNFRAQLVHPAPVAVGEPDAEVAIGLVDDGVVTIPV